MARVKSEVRLLDFLRASEAKGLNIEGWPVTFKTGQGPYQIISIDINRIYIANVGAPSSSGYLRNKRVRVTIAQPSPFRTKPIIHFKILGD